MVRQPKMADMVEKGSNKMPIPKMNFQKPDFAIALLCTCELDESWWLAGENVQTDKVTVMTQLLGLLVFYGLNTISRSKCFHHSMTNVIGFRKCIFKKLIVYMLCENIMFGGMFSEVSNGLS